jgi:hypothetical protein
MQLFTREQGKVETSLTGISTGPGVKSAYGTPTRRPDVYAPEPDVRAVMDIAAGVKPRDRPLAFPLVSDVFGDHAVLVLTTAPAGQIRTLGLHPVGGPGLVELQRVALGERRGRIVAEPGGERTGAKTYNQAILRHEGSRNRFFR